MPVVETVLRSGIPNSPHFTLHDSEHGYRVAGRMFELLGEDGVSRLSDVEVCMLALSAYCHDVGMTPDRQVTEGIRSYLLTGDTSVIDNKIAKDLQGWMDEHTPDYSIPIPVNAVTIDDLSQIDYIASYYGRDRHNEWSADWINAHFSIENGFKLYAGWIDDLVALCKSHHYGLNELRADSFDAKIVGTPPENLNLRYLAAVLRLADVMEFDPERTPEIILQSRNIAPSSRIYWYKDHSISFQLDKDAQQIIFSARTPTAMIHKAVLTTAKWVDDELAICAALAQEGGYQRGNISASSKAKYEWKWPARLTSDIKPIAGTFEYIDGAFRPDPARILSLLSGTALYGQEIVAIRELLQNAIDAVLEETAYSRIQSADPRDQVLADALMHTSSVALRLYEEEGRHWIQCVDSGAGMTKAIIERSLLVGGAPPRGELQSLERAARAKGFEVGRTGKFGIGALSYFMIADRLEVVTRRSQRAGGLEGTGWRFVIEGLSDFGELRREGGIASGSDIRLRMKREFVGEDARKWAKEVFDYIADTLRWSPCRVTVVDEVTDLEPLRLGPGWTRSLENNTPSILNFNRVTDDSSIKPENEANLQALRQERYGRLAGVVGATCKWAKPATLTLSNDLGVARVSIPYFDLPDGNALGYLALEGEEFLALPGRQEMLLPSFSLTHSWKGFLVSQRSNGSDSVWAEVNLVRAMDISVNRQSFTNSSVPKEVKSSISQATKALLITFLRDSAKNNYFLFNKAIAVARYRILGGNDLLSIESNQAAQWKMRESGETESVWREVQFPACALFRTSFMNDVRGRPLKSNAMKIDFAEPIMDQEHSDGLNLGSITGGGRIVFEGSPNSYGSTVGLLWRDASEMRPLDGSIQSLGAEFPAEWPSLLGIYSPVRPIVNRSHRAIAQLSPEARPLRVPTESTALDKLITNLIQNEGMLTEFVIGGMGHGQRFWRGLHERYPEFFAAIIQHFQILGHETVIMWSVESYGNSVVELTRSGVRYSQKGRIDYINPLLAEITSDHWRLRDG
jgi:hypothetical protein